MIGWRARLGFLVPPGNPTVELEMIELAPRGVSVHFTRMVAHGPTGTLSGQEERNRSQIAHMGEGAALLAMVRPDVIVMAHTATSYTLGRDGEADLVGRMETLTGTRFVTAFGSVAAALTRLGARRVALGTPYGEDTTMRSRAHLEAHGFDVVSVGRLENVRNIYDETPERAYGLARKVDVLEADAVFLSGVGMPTIPVLGTLEADLRKPVVSSAAAMMWNGLRTVGVRAPIAGYGRLLGDP